MCSLVFYAMPWTPAGCIAYTLHLALCYLCLLLCCCCAAVSCDISTQYLVFCLFSYLFAVIDLPVLRLDTLKTLHFQGLHLSIP